ncbi:MAG: C10 family peptidase [Prevotellaceae bacterium]|jgi:hypothetical protein|nr:C10 family peptidase [Prevotellaceae bacterium]
MKKIGLFLIAFVLFCVSCEKENTLLQKDEINDNKEVKAKSNYRISIDDAINEVISLLDVIDNNTGNGNTVTTLSASKRRVIKDVQVATKPRTGLTLMSATSGSDENNGSADTLFYVINFEDNQGFAIASADNRYEPVFCVTENGSYHYGDSINNPGFAMVMTNIELLYAAKPPDTAYIPGSEFPIDDGGGSGGGGSSGLICDICDYWVTVVDITQKVKVKWGQWSPYNDNITNPVGAPAGCVATAIAQIMSCYEYPASHNSFNYNWTEMKKHCSYPPTWIPPSGPLWYVSYPNARTYLAHLFYNDIGLGVNMNYNMSGSGASDNAARNYLINRGYTCSPYTDYNIDNVKTVLNQNKLVYISAYATKTHTGFLGLTTTYSNGHAWVIDGYMYRECLCGGIVRETKRLIHCNWGWDGIADGYYANSVFDTRKTAYQDVLGQAQGEWYYRYNAHVMSVSH